jgi:putative flippase GtrA
MERRARTEILRTLKYFMFATSAGVIEMIMFTLLDQFTPWAYWPCYLIALVMSVVWNFTLNRKFTFKSSNNIPVAMVKVAVYYAIFTPFSTILGNFLVETLMWNAYLVTLISLLLNGVTEYLYQRLYVFGKSIDTNLSTGNKKLDVAV